MLKKLGLIELHAGIKKRVEAGTNIPCLDDVPKNTPAPFYFMEVVGKKQANTKTMFCEIYTVWIHAIAPSSGGSVEIYNMIEKLEEALTEAINLPDHVELILQTELGLQTLKTDETNEKHAVLAYEFKVSYGFKMKI